MNATEVFTAWCAELCSDDPNPTIVAALESEAEAQGWSPLTALRAAFDETLHPRGHDGQFIEIGGLIKLISGDHKGERGTVESITPDKKSRRPTIRLRLNNGRSVDVKPDAIEQAADKANLNMSQRTDAAHGTDWDTPAVGRIPRSPKRDGPSPSFEEGALDFVANRHDLDPDAMTDAERLAKRRYEAAFAFETQPQPARLPPPLARKTIKDVQVGDFLYKENTTFPDRPLRYEVIGEPKHVVEPARLDEGYYPIRESEFDEVMVRDLNTGEVTKLLNFAEYDPRPNRQYPARVWDVYDQPPPLPVPLS